jgi:hypothetical protein
LAGEFNWRPREQRSTAQHTTDAEYYAFGVGCTRVTQISHLLTELGIPTISHMFSNSQDPLFASMQIRMYCRTAVAHIATKYYRAPDMAREGEINVSNVPKAEMLADCLTKPLLKPIYMKECAAMGMIRIGLENSLGNHLNIPRRGHGTSIGIVNRQGIGNDNGN